MNKKSKNQRNRRNQRRQNNTGTRKRARKRRNRYLQLMARNKVRNLHRSAAKRAQEAPPKEQKGLGATKWSLITFWGKLLCFIGLHSWAQASGLPGTPKFMCRRCFKRSKRLWPEK